MRREECMQRSMHDALTPADGCRLLACMCDSHASLYGALKFNMIKIRTHCSTAVLSRSVNM